MRDDTGSQTSGGPGSVHSHVVWPELAVQRPKAASQLETPQMALRGTHLPDGGSTPSDVHPRHLRASLGSPLSGMHWKSVPRAVQRLHTGTLVGALSVASLCLHGSWTQGRVSSTHLSIAC